jgi:hypothetical protein
VISNAEDNLKPSILSSLEKHLVTVVGDFEKRADALVDVT